MRVRIKFYGMDNSRVMVENEWKGERVGGKWRRKGMEKGERLDLGRRELRKSRLGMAEGMGEEKSEERTIELSYREREG
jgi:hypothetical protein